MKLFQNDLEEMDETNLLTPSPDPKLRKINSTKPNFDVEKEDEEFPPLEL